MSCTVTHRQFRRVFEPLRDPGYFRQVRVHPELFVICWPNGADIDSDVLYSLATGTPLPFSESTPA